MNTPSPAPRLLIFEQRQDGASAQPRKFYARFDGLPDRNSALAVSAEKQPPPVKVSASARKMQKEREKQESSIELCQITAAAFGALSEPERQKALDGASAAYQSFITRSE
ncbi:MAG: hypothetical protein JWO73_222 [Candidatus Taylorbacteria bacterium]|nr:hypothetical protein [Candidatus Taylorbacteria bacterium]